MMNGNVSNSIRVPVLPGVELASTTNAGDAVEETKLVASISAGAGAGRCKGVDGAGAAAGWETAGWMTGSRAMERETCWLWVEKIMVNLLFPKDNLSPFRISRLL